MNMKMSFVATMKSLIIKSLDPNDAIGVKRVALLLCLMYFILSSFAITIIGGVLSFKASNGNIAFVNIYSVQTALVMKYNFLIVTFLIGAVTATDFGKLMVDKATATTPDINVQDGSSPTIVQKVDTITPVDNVTVQNADVINTKDVTQKDIKPIDNGG